MTSKERVLMSFSHKEPDKVPVSELYINSPVASKVLGRLAYTGWSGYIRCDVMSTMLMENRGEEFFLQEAIDLVELYKKLDLDTILIERPPMKQLIIPKKIGEGTWRYEDPENGMWRIEHYDKATDLFHTVDSNFHQGGLEEFRRYVDILENDPIDLDTYNWCQADYICDHCKDKFIMAVVEIDFPPMSMGAIGALFRETLAFERDLAERYLDYRVRKGLKFIEKYSAMGVDCIFDGEDLAGNTGPMISPAMYLELYASRFLKLSKKCHDCNMKYLRHTDGNIMLFADEFLLQSGFDGYQSIDPSAGMNALEIKKKYGDVITLMGNVDCGAVLHLGTKNDVIRDTK
ncbi:MAG: hypothetical protein LBE13_12885, partial [Bacteroidales bacterium]|nr:hypothetical protein [Bacteroidales bacterium]